MAGIEIHAGGKRSSVDQRGDPPPNLRRIMVATFFGQITEWYDYGIYALVAVQIGAHFFPSGDKTASLLAALAVFGVAFLARPVGGIWIGVMGDRIGRKSVLVYSLLMMTVATVMVGILPGAEVIGIIAPALLVTARLLQGISAAGESTSAITYVAESVPPDRKGLYTATLMSGNSAGFLLATSVVWLLHEILGEAVFDDWGWRGAFLFAGPLGLIGLFIRSSLEESPVFERLKEGKILSATPLRDTFTTGLDQLFQAIGISATSMIANYLVVAYLPIHLQGVGYTSRDISIVGMIATMTLLVSYPVMGAISDRIGRRPVLMAACIFFMLLGWPLFALTIGGSLAMTAVATCLLALGTSGFISSLGLYCTEYIDKSRLMTTYSVGFNLSAAMFGGSSLWAFGMSVKLTGDPRMPAIYLIVASAISMVSLLSIRSTRRVKSS